MRDAPAINILALLALSGNQDADLIDNLGGNFSDALKQAMAKRNAERAEEASGQILQIMRRIETTKNASRIRLHELRAQEKVEKKKLDDVDRAWAFAQHTQDFGPILCCLNLVGAYPAEVTREVPSNWNPPTSPARSRQARESQ